MAAHGTGSASAQNGDDHGSHLLNFGYYHIMAQIRQLTEKLLTPLGSMGCMMLRHNESRKFCMDAEQPYKICGCHGNRKCRKEPISFHCCLNEEGLHHTGAELPHGSRQKARAFALQSQVIS